MVGFGIGDVEPSRSATIQEVLETFKTSSIYFNDLQRKEIT
jgi:hypothetical protein